MRKTSYHIHTKFSDGKSSIRQIIESAIEKGLEEIGISDHYVLNANREQFGWSLKIDSIDYYVSQVLKFKQEYKNSIAIRLGLEADYFPETESELRRIINNYPFDYVIGSVHFFEGFPIDECKERWSGLSQSEVDIIIRGYWSRISQMAYSGIFDIAGHLDLYKKFGARPSCDISGIIDDALNEIAIAGMSVEINTSGVFKSDFQEPYPSLDIIRKCKKKDIPFVVTSDAHDATEVDRLLEHCRLMVAGVGNIWLSTFANRKMTLG